MQGKILDYNNEFKSGLIRGEDGNKYRFSIDDCQSAINPRTNAEVDFEPSEDKAVEVYVLTKDTVDDIKDVASLAVNATTNVAREAVEKTKLIIPTIITLVILGGIGLAIWYVVNDYLPQQKRLQIEEDRVALMKEGNQLLKSGDYQNAISKFESAKTLDQNNYYKSYRQCINDDTSGSCESIEQYDFKIAQAYIGLKNPDQVLQLLGDPWSDTPGNPKAISIFEQIGNHPMCRTVSGCIEATDKAKFCILTSKAYHQKGNKRTAQTYAQLACDHGDCSLVEK